MKQLTTSKVRMSEKVGYGFGDVASCLFWQTFSAYLAIYYTDIFGLTAAAAGTLLMVTRFLDISMDPVMGIIADRTNTRMGKFRPYLIWIPIPLGIVMVLTFTVPDLGTSGKLIYAYLTYTSLMLLYSAVNIPYAAMLGVMTNRTEDRTALSSFRMAGAFLGGLIVFYSNYGLSYYFSVAESKVSDIFSTAWTAFTSAFDTSNEGGPTVAEAIEQSLVTPDGYRSAIIVYVILAVVLFYLAFRFTKERVKPAIEQNQNWKIEVWDLLRNKPWLILVAVTILKNGFSGFRTGMIIYYFKYYVVNESLSAMYLVIGSLVSIFSILFIPYIAPCMGKKKLYVISVFAAGIFSVLSYFPDPTDFRIIFTYQILISLCMAAPTALLWSLYADTADYSEYTTGRRSTGLIFSASGMCQKLGGMLMASVALWVLDAYSFVANEVPSTETLTGIRMLISVYPACCCFGAGIIMVFYPLDEKRVQDIEDKLSIRNEDALEASEGKLGTSC